MPSSCSMRHSRRIPIRATRSTISRATYIQKQRIPKAFPLIDKLVTLDPSNPDNPLL